MFPEKPGSIAAWFKIALAHKEMEWPRWDIYMPSLAYVGVASVRFSVFMVRKFLPQVGRVGCVVPQGWELIIILDEDNSRPMFQLCSTLIMKAVSAANICSLLPKRSLQGRNMWTRTWS